MIGTPLIDVDEEEVNEKIESCLAEIPGYSSSKRAEKEIIRTVLQALCPMMAIVIMMAAKQAGGSMVFWQGANAVPKRRRTERCMA